MSPVRIVLVEDNEGDIVLTTEMFEDSKFINELIVFRDGDELMTYIASCLNGLNNSLPDLILLDINLPSINGIEVLNHLKFNEKTKGIPVIILSTSNVAIDVNKAFEREVSAFLTKPLSFDVFFKTMINHTNFQFQLIKN